MDGDERLRQRLRAAAGETPSGAPVLEELRPRMVRERRRRRIALAGTMSGVLLIGVASAYALTGRDDTEPLYVDVPPASSTFDTATTTVGTSGATSQSSTTVPSPTVGLPSTTIARPSVPATTSAPTTTAAPPVSTGSPGSTGSTGTTQPPSSVPGTATYDSRGGSITVRNTGTQLVLVSVTARPGWTPETKESGPIDIEVKFRMANPEDEAKIHLRLQGGQIVPEIE